MGKFAAGGIEKEIRQEVDNTMSSFGGVFSRATGRDNLNNVTSIEWTHFNYPPMLRIIHFDLKELPSPVAKIVRFIHFSFLIAVIALLLNFIDSIVLTIGGIGSLRLLYSSFNFIIFTPAAGYTFYQGYRALAMSSPTYTTRYLICQGIMAAIAMLFVLAPSGAMNGLVTFHIMETTVQVNKVSAGIKGFWMVAVIMESVLWASSLLIGLYGFYKAWRFNPYHSQQARAGGGLN